MGKNQSASGLTNIVQYDNNGNISLVSGSTTLLYISSSGAITTTGVISGSNALSASYAATASFVTLAQTASFVTTAQTASFVANAQSASNAVAAQTASFANAFTVAGTLTAQTLVVQTITSSVDFVTGSTRFGSIIDNTHQFTGSITTSGSVGIGTSSIKSYSSLTAANQIVGLNNIAVDSGQSFRLNNYYNSGTTTDRAISAGYGASIGLNQTNGGLVFNMSSATSSADNNITTTERMRITSTGNVGIGTSSPGSRLTVRGTDSNSMLYLGISGSSSNGEAVGITFGSATYDKARIVAYNENSGNAAGYLTLWTGGSPGTTDVTERMRITSGGNVTIGSTSTVTDSHLLNIQGSTVSYNVGIVLNKTNATAQIWGITNTGPLTFYDYTNSAERMRIKNDGNVGIGTTNPLVKLEVYGDSSDAIKLRIKNVNSNGSAGLIINPEGTGGVANGDATIFFDVNANAWVAGVDKSDSSKFKISNDVYGDFRANNFFTIRTNGNVGIGTTNPSKTLEVNGRMSTQAIVSGGIIAGNIASNMPAAPAYIPIFNLAESAGFSLTGFVNAASYTCFNMSQIYIRKQYTTSTINAGITGFYKSACDFSIVNITYSGTTYVALRFTGDPEIDVVWTGYLLTNQFNSDGSAQVWTSGVTLNSTYASY